jgi:alginate O-acetyltransferase complex protein AlgI
LPQLGKAPHFDEAAQASGLFLIAGGLVKKMLIGDTLAGGLVNRVFASPERFSSLEVLVAVYAYAFQIYADFSGYTDVARGSARLFGLELPLNFDRPYTSRDLQDFWRRWHISLSSWLRDYLYIPLGGSRGSAFATYRNLTITMLLGGLWHGASWNFVIWGALHGLALAFTRMWQRWRGSSAEGASPASAVLATIATFHFVCFAWIFFRAPTFEHARLALARIAEGSHGAANLSPRVLAVLLLAAGLHFTPPRWLDEARHWFVARPAWVQGTVLAGLFYALHFVATAKPEPFIYGQF